MHKRDNTLLWYVDYTNIMSPWLYKCRLLDYDGEEEEPQQGNENGICLHDPEHTGWFLLIQTG